MRRTPLSVARFARSARFAVAAIGAALLVACESSTETQNRDSDPATDRYAAALNVDVGTFTKRPSGLYVRDDLVGSGATVVASQRVRVHYTLYLVDGRKIDSSRDPGREPFVFRTANGEVVPGFDEGVVGMRVGGKRRLLIPSRLGYGPGGSGNVPPNATLVFDIELLSIL